MLSNDAGELLVAEARLDVCPLFAKAKGEANNAVGVGRRSVSDKYSCECLGSK